MFVKPTVILTRADEDPAMNRWCITLEKVHRYSDTSVSREFTMNTIHTDSFADGLHWWLG